MAPCFLADEHAAQTRETPVGELARVLELFSASPEEDRWQEAVAAQLRGSAARHAGQARIHSSIQQAELNRLFLDAAVPEEANSFQEQFC